MKIFKNILKRTNGNKISIIKQPIKGLCNSMILGYDIENNEYTYFKLIPFENFIPHYYNNPFKNYYFCAIINNELIFPKLSGCKKLYII